MKMANEKRLIDADKLMDRFRIVAQSGGPVVVHVSDICAAIEDEVYEESVDAVEVVHGRWEQIGYDKAMDRISCSVCKEYWNICDNDTETFNYCPNCGAKMEVQTMKDKLIEIIRSVQYNDNGSTIGNNFQSRFVERIADHLIANGVTFAKDNNVPNKWIPVTERLPGLHDDVLMYFEDDGNMAAGYLDDVDEDRSMWSAYSDGGYFTDCDYEPTHWMPLPEPPKEVDHA
jgi:hypothetical protein